MTTVVQTLRSLKWRRRAWVVATNAANSVLVPALGVLVSFFVIRLASLRLWGEFVSVMLWVQLAAHVMGWGNKDYLLRAFSLRPAYLTSLWQSALVTRAALLVPFGVGVWLLGIPPLRAALILLWGAALFLDQSADVLIQYRKDFLFSLVVELVGLAALLAPILWLRERLTLDWLIALFAIVFLGKALAFLARYRTVTLARPGRQEGDARLFQPALFRLALPFFLLGLSGLLQSRVDQYVVNAKLPPTEVAQYQVFMNLMIYLQSVSVFILGPFVKSVYRLHTRTILRLTLRLAVLGLLVVGPGLMVTYAVLRLLYHLTFAPAYFVFGGLLALPVFAYLPLVYALYKLNRQTWVLVINLLGIGASLALSLALLPRYGMLGAVAASAVAQWAMLLAYGAAWLARGDVLRAVPELP